MVEIKKGNIWCSDADIIVCPVDTLGAMCSDMIEHIKDYCPHVATEYLRYIKHCNKHNICAKSTVQFVPSESWAMPMVDTIVNTTLVPCEDFQYLANIFCQYDSDDKMVDNISSFGKCMRIIRDKAESINVKTIAIPALVCENLNEYDYIYKIIQETFAEEKTNIIVKIYVDE